MAGPNRASRARTGIPPVTESAGLFQGRHFTDYVEEVKSLRRSGHDAQALDLLGHLIDATEAEALASPGWGVAPWYYLQLATICKRLGDAAGERAVLERFASQPHAPGSQPKELLARLERVRSQPRTP